MGRTNPTYRRWLDQYETSWQPFRRALRRDERAAFDRLFERAGTHAAAAGMQNAPMPEQAFLLAILLSHEQEINALREEHDA